MFTTIPYIPVWSPQAPGLPRKFSEIMRVQHLAERQAHAAPTSFKDEFFRIAFCLPFKEIFSFSFVKGLKECLPNEKV